jgi:methionyl-tRNA formyltransferase
MKVFILTKYEYRKFIVDTTMKFYDIHNPNILVCDEEDCFFPEEYDIGISFMWTKRVPKSELDKAVWFNFHPAPLPEYRGRNLCYHAILNGEKEFGATIHYMDENFDTGDIIEVRRFDIQDWMTAGDVSAMAIASSMKLFREYIPRILNGEDFECIPNVGGTYYQKEPIDDVILVDWFQEDRIRAITYGKFYPKVVAGGVTYKIVRDE